ncbi:hypothetical protein A3K80_09180 [Candidatus Bathyarchaeota archaeon RBG_13_38_9]|nr:MAG: hypothetical protein A3K80_09180 [Candidatus Bathyarchaeota archaeon RBG_13_38_9]
MGWEKYIFDVFAQSILDDDKEFSKREVLKQLINILEEVGWDCQGESAYFECPLVQEIFKELHPDWFD